MNPVHVDVLRIEEEFLHHRWLGAAVDEDGDAEKQRQRRFRTGEPNWRQLEESEQAFHEHDDQSKHGHEVDLAAAVIVIDSVAKRKQHGDDQRPLGTERVKRRILCRWVLA